MSIEVVCSDCSTKVRVEYSQAGKSLVCQYCGATISVPHTATDEALDDLPSNFRPLNAEELAPAGWEVAEELRAPRTSSASKSSPEVKSMPPLPKSNAGRLALATLLLAATAFVGMWLGSIMWEAWRSPYWPGVEGTVVRSEFVRAGKGWRLNLHYRYKVDGQSYDGDRVTFAGNSGLFCGDLNDFVSSYPAHAQVLVYYNPRNPASAALRSGVPTALGFLMLPLLMLATCVVLFGWSTYAAAFGPPRRIVDPDFENPRSVSQRALIAAIGASIALVCVGLTVQFLLLPTTVPSYSRSAGIMALMLFVGVVFAMFSMAGVWLGTLVVMSALKRPETINDLRNAPDSPQFSRSSLICFSAGMGSSVAVILDRGNGKIHFKRCFQKCVRSFSSGFSEAWWSCSLHSITGLSQMTYKGQTTFIIETEHGKASISTRIDNYAELRNYLENRQFAQPTRALSNRDDIELPEFRRDSEPTPVEADDVPEYEPDTRQTNRTPRPMPVKTAYAPGQKPLDWRVGMCIVGLFLGPVVGMIVGSMLRARDIGAFAAWGMVLGGCSGLPFFRFKLPRQLSRFVASANGMRVGGGVVGLLVFCVLKLFTQTRFLDLLVLIGAGTVLGFLFARRRAK